MLVWFEEILINIITIDVIVPKSTLIIFQSENVSRQIVVYYNTHGINQMSWAAEILHNRLMMEIEPRRA